MRKQLLPILVMSPLALVLLFIIPWGNAHSESESEQDRFSDAACPEVVDISRIGLEQPLYYALIKRYEFIQIWSLDGEGVQTLLWEFDSVDTPFFRIRLSPSREQIAVLFLQVKSDPPYIGPKSDLVLANLRTGEERTFTVEIEEGYLLASNPSYLTWIHSDLDWGWANEEQIVFNWNDARHQLDVETGTFQTYKWPAPPVSSEGDIYTRMPWTDTGDYIFYERPAGGHGMNLIYLTILDTETGVFVREDMMVNRDNLSFGADGQSIVVQRSSRDLMLINLAKNTELFISRRGWSEYSLAGYFVPSPSSSWIAYQSEVWNYETDNRIYMIDYSVPTDTLGVRSPGKLIPLCVTLDLRYDESRASWSDDGLYQFSDYDTLYVYDPQHHQIARTLSFAELENDDPMTWRVLPLGWGSSTLGD